MAIVPIKGNWWNAPVERTEALWIGIALVWAIIMFFMMPYWHMVGNQNLSTEAYKVTPDAYEAKVDAFVEKYQVREEGDTGIPVVKPPAGGDVYLLARQFEWYPIVELEKGQNYRIHVSSMDVQHGLSIQPANINIQVHPYYEMIFNATPTDAGEYGIVCNEYCDIGHHTMLGKLYVK